MRLRSTFAAVLAALLLVASWAGVNCDASCVQPAGQHACCPAQMDRGHAPDGVAAPGACAHTASLPALVVTAAGATVTAPVINPLPDIVVISTPHIVPLVAATSSPPKFHFRI